jgi:hypothetical protein
MKRWQRITQFLAFLFLSAINPLSANATCPALPNNLANGQVADASQVMANFTTLSGCINSNGIVSAGSAGQIGIYGLTGSTISGETLSDVIDLSFGTAQGSILYRGAGGWVALAPGTPSQVLSTGGPGANPSWVVLPAGLTSPYYASLQPPAAGDFSLVKATGVTATLNAMASGRGLTMNSTGSGSDTISSMERAVLSQSSFTITTCIYLASSNSDNWFVGIGVSDSSGKYDAFGWRNNYSNLGTFNEFNFPSIGQVSQTTNLFGTFNPSGPLWLRLQLVTGNFIFSASFDGENWEQIQTVSATHFLGSTLSKAVVIIDNNSSHHMIVDNLSWSQSTP